MTFFQLSDPVAARRLFLGRSSLLLSGAAVALLAGKDALAAKSGAAGAGDVQILNTALGAEYEAIAAYQVGAESKLLQAPVLELAVTFQGHHKAHADALAKLVEKLGGKPVLAKTSYHFPVDQLKSQADVLRFAAKLEQGAVSAYLGAVPLFRNRDLSKAAAIGRSCARRSVKCRCRRPSWRDAAPSRGDRRGGAVRGGAGPGGVGPCAW
jgi:bacterioferritin (cytochrome b1)